MEEKKTNQTQEPEKMKLDDARRVKSMSPGQMVMKRFIRNRLAVTGLVIIVAMFLFSFIGPFFSSYTESQVFKTTEYLIKDYAGAVENTDLVFYANPEKSASNQTATAFKKAVGQGETSFTSDGINYSYEEIGEGIYEIFESSPVATVMTKGKAMLYTGVDGFEVSDDFKKAFEAANTAGETAFTFEDQEYVISKGDRSISVGIADTAAYATALLFDAYDVSDTIASDYAFEAAVLSALAKGEDSFELSGETYTFEKDQDTWMIHDSSDTIRALVSTMKINAKASDVKLSGEFKIACRDAVQNGAETFTITDADGNETEYTIRLNNGTYLIRAYTPSEVTRAYEGPSLSHPLGMDGYGMDVLTRLMYGGRVSLLVGFVVVFLEIIIGIIIGGISGFFGGIVDSILMRFVDLFNSIPFWPMVLIFGSLMDGMEMSSTARLFVLMAILGILNWTGIARVVRGQILTLREQDFMVATEATGIRVSRRIFRHLVPNVMPLLIVQATMSLGSVILTEATMSFLGLGVKYPMASWGSIINAANDIQVMTNYWFIWLPSGLLIMLTVLGFNFIGDGLRDAFDPRMKR